MEGSKIASVILSYTNRICTGSDLKLKRNLWQLSRPILLEEEKCSRKQRGKEGAPICADGFLFPPLSQV